jgi:hypothetical protein
VRLALLPFALLLAGCGAGIPPGASIPPTASPSATAPPPAAPGPSTPAASAPAPPPRLAPARCAADAGPSCAAHTGRVLAVESVDPDGDGDLHVIAAGGSISAPGITVFDVSETLRPARDPRPGDRVTGAGPVYRGSFRQRQIEVTTFRVARVESSRAACELKPALAPRTREAATRRLRRCTPTGR